MNKINLLYLKEDFVMVYLPIESRPTIYNYQFYGASMYSREYMLEIHLSFYGNLILK